MNVYVLTYIDVLHEKFHSNHLALHSTYYINQLIENFLRQNDDHYISNPNIDQFFSHLHVVKHACIRYVQ